jgi:hypothetical protein
VIIWWCHLQLHMSYITEIQEAVVHIITTTTVSCISVIYDICSCKSHHDRITTTTASCISVIHDICSCKSHHHMFTNTTAPWSYGGVIYNYICHVLLKYKGRLWSWSYGGVIYNYIWDILLKYKSSISAIYDICSCISHHHLITTTTASCISVIYDICSCKSHHHIIHLHMSYITEIQEAVVVVIIWWCDL